MSATSAALVAPAAQAPGIVRDPASDAPGGVAAFGADGFTFGDFLDIINPLQHIPVVSTIYRELTGDEIDPGARVLGGGLFGGFVGAFLGLINGALEHETGKDLGGHMAALLRGGSDADGTTVATARPPTPGTVGGDVGPPPAEAAAAARAYQASIPLPPIGQIRETWP